MTNEELENLLSGFPSGRIRVPRIMNGEIEKISFYNCIGNTPSLELFFKALYEASAAKYIKAMEFYCDGDDYKSAAQIDPQEAMDLLARYGPFEKLEDLSIYGEDYIAAHAIKDFSTLQDTAPALRKLDLRSTRGVHLQRRLELKKLRHLIFGDISFDQLGKLGKCSFPDLEVLEISFSEQDGQLKLEKELLNAFCEGRLSKRLKKLFLAVCDLSIEQEKQLIDHFIEVFPGSPLLQGLTFLELLDFHFSAEQLERLSQKKENFMHLKKFYLGGDVNTWPEMKKSVGNFVSTPRMVRDHELKDINVFPEDIGEMRSQIGGVVNQIKSKDSPKLNDIQFIAGVICRQDGENNTRAWAVVTDNTSMEVVETASSICENDMEIPRELDFYRQAPAVLEALSCLKTPFQLVLCESAVEKTPYEFSLANYLGLRLNLPTIGCADEISFGKFIPPNNEACEAADVMSGGRDSDHRIAVCLRTQKGKKPVFVSTGHKISLQTAANLVLELSPKDRFPEPLRAAREVAEERK